MGEKTLNEYFYKPAFGAKGTEEMEKFHAALDVADKEIKANKDANLKVKLDATTAPGVGNDNTEGYVVGSRWIDKTNHKEYVALDVSTGAAIWIETTQSGGGGDVTKTGDFTAGKITKINNASGIIEEGTNTDTDVADAVTKKHANTLDHSQDTDQYLDFGGDNQVAVADAKDAVTKKHSQDTDADLDDTFEATFVKKADTVNVLSDITSAGADIEDAVTKKHSQDTDADLDDTFEATFVKKADTVNVLSDITSAGADIEDAVTKKHSQDTDADLDDTFEATFVKKADTVNVLSDITSAGADIEDAVTKKHTQNTDVTLVFTNALGSDHSYSGEVDSQPVGENVVFGQLLYYDWTDVEWKLAKADASTTVPGLRIALESKANSEICLMLVKGYIRDDDAFEFAGAMVYVSEITAGAMTSTAPSTATNQLQRVGQAKSADILFFDPSIDVGEI